MNVRSMLVCLFAAAAPTGAASQAGRSPDQVTLSAIELSAAKPISAVGLSQVMAANARILLFDVRNREEYRVSHLPAARHLEPTSTVASIIRRARRGGKGAVVVFYCTIGARSTAVAETAADALKAQGAADVRVLELGIIGWANAGLPLVDRVGPTRLVHTFDAERAQHLTDPARARFEKREGY